MRLYGPWDPGSEPAGETLTPKAVRDMIVDCFTATHGQQFSEDRTELGMDARPDAVRESVVGIVRLAFRQVGGDFDNPRAADLARVVNLLAERSLSWGVPQETVFQHHCSMTRVLGRLATLEN